MKALLVKLPPSIQALLLQFTAFLFVIVVLRLSALHPAPLLTALCIGLCAAGLSQLYGLARWWLFIQFSFAPALVLMLALDLPPVLFLTAFLVMLVVYWSTFRTQVPLYLSSQQVWQALESQLPQDRPFSFIDLGAGIGGVLTHLAHARPQGRFVGVEAAPLPFMWGWLRIKLGGHHSCNMQWKSLWHCDLAQYDVVYAYLSPVPMPELWQKAKREMRPGTLFISNTFTVPDHPSHDSVTVNDLHHSTLHIWHM